MTIELTFQHGIAIGFVVGLMGRQILPLARWIARRTPTKKDDLALDLVEGLADVIDPDKAKPAKEEAE